MIKLTQGPGMDPPQSDGAAPNACIRLLSSYYIATDEVVTRIDVVMGFGEERHHGWRAGNKGAQFNVALPSSGKGQLSVPPNGSVLGGHSANVCAEDLRDALRALADEIDRRLAKTVEQDVGAPEGPSMLAGAVASLRS